MSGPRDSTRISKYHLTVCSLQLTVDNLLEVQWDFISKHQNYDRPDFFLFKKFDGAE